MLSDGYTISGTGRVRVFPEHLVSNWVSVRFVAQLLFLLKKSVL